MSGAKAGTVLFVATLLITSFTATTAGAQDILIGTGETAIVHQKIGRMLCRSVSRAIKGMKCETERIAGLDAAEPLAVLTNVQSGAVDLAIVQSDWQYHAVNGTGPVKFVHLKFDNLRALFSLHSEPFTLVARKDSGIKSDDDLVGKRVNIGSPGSPERQLMGLVMKAKGWNRRNFLLADELTAFEQTLALCHNRIQATASVVTHPHESVAKAMELCDARIVDVAGKGIEALIADNPYFSKAVIPAGLYKGQDKAVTTFGSTLTVVTSADLPDEIAYAVVKSVFDNLESIKRVHPALGHIEPNQMMERGRTAPVHDGAKRYFDERGLS